ncbi:hypothetical protein AAEX37_01028 [Oligella sp. MSHR50489EDL]|uniref:GPO family capsid scaffolding protein n=1 Tax=Oligella sp. MSHR50489EDL TaxID=3139409 RepID=UPI003D8125EA
MLITKYFRVATEGKTADNRVIHRSWLEQAAKNYNQKKYNAGIWVEHFRGFSPDSAFGRYGDVVSLKTEEDSDGKLALFAQVAPSHELIELNRQGKKLFGSIEISENFADTGEAYLVGLGITDSPASLSVERIQLFSDRKQHPDNIFSIGEELNFEIEDKSEDENKTSLGDYVKKMFSRLRREHQSNKEDFTEAINPVVEGIVELENQVNQYASELAVFRDEIKALNEHVKTLQSDLKTYSEAPANVPERPVVDGNSPLLLTDC